MFSRRFWIETAERAAKTAGQTFLGAVGVNQYIYSSLNWEFIGIITGVTTLLSVASSLASLKLGTDKGGPSAV